MSPRYRCEAGRRRLCWPGQTRITTRGCLHRAAGFTFKAGRKPHEWLGQGDIVNMPANVPHRDRWDKPGEFTLLILDPTPLSRIAEPSADPSCIQIRPRFAMRHELI
jgi:hypothetical protein